MNSTLLCVALLSTLAVGCGRAAVQPQAKAPSSQTAQAKAPEAVASEEKGSEPALAAAPAAVQPPGRAPGDFVVHRFSGSFREAPITLTQRIIAREGDLLVIDMTLEEGSAKQALRVRMDDSPAKRGEVVSVARLENGREKPAGIELYDEMMAKTVLAADQNEEVLGSEALTVDVGGAPMQAQKTSYRVKLGKLRATLKTVQSDSFAWGDLSGEITTASGDVVYRAELVEAGHADAPKPPVVAQSVAQSDEYVDLDEE
jgi:hypothetical protein